MTTFQQRPLLVRTLTRAGDYALHDVTHCPAESTQHKRARQLLADVLDVVAELAPANLGRWYRVLARRNHDAAGAPDVDGSPLDRVLKAVLDVALWDVDHAPHIDGFRAAALTRLSEIQGAVADHVTDPALAQRWRRAAESSARASEEIFDEIKRPPWSASA